MDALLTSDELRRLRAWKLTYSAERYFDLDAPTPRQRQEARRLAFGRYLAATARIGEWMETAA